MDLVESMYENINSTIELKGIIRELKGIIRELTEKIFSLEKQKHEDDILIKHLNATIERQKNNLDEIENALGIILRDVEVEQ